MPTITSCVGSNCLKYVNKGQKNYIKYFGLDWSPFEEVRDFTKKVKPECQNLEILKKAFHLVKID